MPVDPLDAEHIARLQPWLIRAYAKIDDVMEDVAAHAACSLTRGIISADDGRQTWRMLNRQRSAKAAQKRLDELMAWFVGRGKSSLDGFIQDARAKFYKEAFEHWRAGMEFAKVLDVDAAPTTTGERQARGLIIHEASPRQEIEPKFLAASNRLRTAMNAAAIQGLAERQQTTVIETWQHSTADSLKLKVKEMLSDSQIKILGIVGRSMVKPELRPK